ncbi:myb-like protein H isoform X1 [Cinnamomum micranthum f. kanehirae]|uniref:Myb-like protein H isoform X1 n=1 Tax=Cinnamomum micranthum f. kanehirae TaxID=337451 RepID=A0A3S3QUW4_9MAGN|nr:myb-like protein H isoform X1 [Cinnamomum micranthum f. kanehirae]
MTSNKGAVECCMCGDYGLPHELFRCRSCHFRSQHRYGNPLSSPHPLHGFSSILTDSSSEKDIKLQICCVFKDFIHGCFRYCSDLYPKAESYQLCNWCLKEDGGKAMKEAIENISNSNKNISTSSSGSNEVGLKLQRCSFPLHLNSPIKKQRSPERSTQKKNNISDESLRRTRSEDISIVTRQKQVSRGKVRRYKLLEEVSS